MSGAAAALILKSVGPQDTFEIGRALGRLLRGGEVLALSGPLGAGKTQLVKGVAAGLDVPADEPVVSPTFVLVREYAGRLRLWHLDTYRLGDVEELWSLGWDELLDAGGVVAVEWADRVAPAMPPEAWWVHLSHKGPQERGLRLVLPGVASGAAAVLAGWRDPAAACP